MDFSFAHNFCVISGQMILIFKYYDSGASTKIRKKAYGRILFHSAVKQIIGSKIKTGKS